FFVGFLLQKRLMFLPERDQIAGLDVMDKSRIRVNPFGFPAIAANVLQNPDALQRHARATLFAEGVLDAGFYLRLPHRHTSVRSDDPIGAVSSILTVAARLTARTQQKRRCLPD